MLDRRCRDTDSSDIHPRIIHPLLANRERRNDAGKVFVQAASAAAGNQRAIRIKESVPKLDV